MHRTSSTSTPFGPGPHVVRRITAAAGVLFLAACAGGPAASSAGPASPPPDGRVVQAGAPGEASRAYEAPALSEVEGAAYTDADVAFMQGMIHHHAQALEMTALIPDRTDERAITQMGLRMQISQADEIAIMERWLRERGHEVPVWGAAAADEMGMDHDADHQMAGHEMMDHEAMDHDMMDHGSDHSMMPGMLTPEQMAQLEAARDRDFDRLFLELMIQHHEGAVTMVMDLYNSPGAAQESIVYQFASDIDADQGIEIRRMRELLEAWR